ncbi:MAG: PAS domain S-box protein [Acidobacteria bacterium]|nr:PAS domain S-box protein [Acidobacteriota bacterium]
MADGPPHDAGPQARSPGDAGIRPLIRRLVVGLVTLLALGLSAGSMYRTLRTFRVLDFSVNWREDGLQVVQVPPGSTAERSGLHSGDTIVSIDDRLVSTMSDPTRVFLSVGGHRLTVHRQDGTREELLYQPPALHVDPVYLARSLVALVGLVCAVIAVLGTGRREATTFFLLVLASLIVATVPHRIAGMSVVLRLVHRAAGAAIPFLLVRFFVVFPRARRMWPWWDVVTVLVMAVAGSTAFSPLTISWWPALAIGLRAAFIAALLAVAVIQIRQWRLAVRLAVIRRQIEWTALGMFVGLFPYAALVLLPRWLDFSFEPFSWLAVLPVAAIPVSFLAALARYRLWDLEPITRDVVSATLAVVFGGLVFATLNVVLLPTLEQAGPLRNLLAFGTGVLLVLLLVPMRARVGAFLDRWLYHGRPAPRRLVTEVTRELAETADPILLLERVTQTLADTLELEPVASYLRVSQGWFRRVTGAGPPAPEELPASVATHAFPAPEEAAMAQGGYAERFLLERAGTVHGLLYIGLRRAIFPLGTEGREMIRTLTAQAALGLESARLMEDLRSKAEEYRILHTNTRRIIESSAAGILVCDASGRVLSGNTRAQTILGSEQLVGRELRQLIRLPEGWGPQLPVHAVNAEGETLGRETRRVIMAVSVLELESGQFNGRVVVLQDVTELRELEEKLREQERLAALGRLASGLAHEINTPLTGIASYAEMLGEMTAADDPRSELVHKLVSQSFRVSRIVANLKAAMRGVGSEQTLLDAGAVTRRAAVEAAQSLEAEDRLRLDLAREPLPVRVAESALILAISNLVRNALEASPPESVVVVGAASTPTEIEIRVDDAGPGVPEELREQVFEPFFTTRSHRGGTGLGLAITRDMIARQGGEVRLTASPQGGTRAVIRLPRTAAAAS